MKKCFSSVFHFFSEWHHCLIYMGINFYRGDTVTPWASLSFRRKCITVYLPLNFFITTNAWLVTSKRNTRYAAAPLGNVDENVITMGSQCCNFLLPMHNKTLNRKRGLVPRAIQAGDKHPNLHIVRKNLNLLNTHGSIAPTPKPIALINILCTTI